MFWGKPKVWLTFRIKNIENRRAFLTSYNLKINSLEVYWTQSVNTAYHKPDKEKETKEDDDMGQ